MIFKFTEEEKAFLLTLSKSYNFKLPQNNDWDYETSEIIRDAAMDYEAIHGLGSDYEPTEAGKIAIAIADKLLAA